MAAPGASEGGVGGGGEHLGEAVFAEAVAALEQERDSLVLVVPRVAHGTTGDLHLRRNHLEKALESREIREESRRKEVCEKSQSLEERERERERELL